ncbi:hypothetical protein [Pseudomonas aeruginosa]|uniref:hypothetical protein n=1 Tax=Pseudomonas aeruginosa TaxID=287 RepID=UPI000FC3FFE1|nr:hypothetical protein [Pseudomonas aeruginosa]RUD93114.1 hypothetical protein IPC1228_31480 [Pseudomonas aeruginosa]
MKKDSFTEEQASLLRTIFSNKSSSSLELIDRLLAGEVTRSERLFICELINEEFCETGLDENGEPTKRGFVLEALLDVVNRPNLL